MPFYSTNPRRVVVSPLTSLLVCWLNIPVHSKAIVKPGPGAIYLCLLRMKPGTLSLAIECRKPPAYMRLMEEIALGVICFSHPAKLAREADIPSPSHGNPMKTSNLSSFVASLALLVMSLPALAADEKKVDADNTKKNERDRSAEQKTPTDQSNSPEDLKITQAIRQAVVKDSSLTMTAKNVKIITAGGTVTLRGPVKTAEEKTKIESLAKSAAGNTKVDNQLEVKDSPKK